MQVAISGEYVGHRTISPKAGTNHAPFHIVSVAQRDDRGSYRPAEVSIQADLAPALAALTIGQTVTIDAEVFLSKDGRLRVYGRTLRTA